MKFGPIPPKKVPEQNPQKALLLAERWQRAAFAHEKWATGAKVCVDFVEGRQWTAEQLAEMERQKRPALTFNVTAPLVRLVLGYHRNNKTDITFRPGQDARATPATAEALSRVEKAVADVSKLPFVDTEVFMDGLICSRGFYDTRLNWDHNDLGEIRSKALDPFSVYIDPDADTYDLNESASYLTHAKWVSMDEIEAAFGNNIASLVKPFTMGQTPLSPISSVIVNDEITPVRYFGQREDFVNDWWDNFYSLMGDFVDTRRKTIRVLETQYKVSEVRNVIIDLETGDKKVLPQTWDRDKIARVLFHCEEVGNPCVVQARPVESIQWTTMAGDLLLYDAPSFYDRYTITGYFPYFRRGMTRGMVEDLIDPQKEKNKRRSARIETESKTANGGWTYHENSLDPIQEQRLKKFGSRPGVAIKWKGEAHMEPKQLQPAQHPVGQQRLESDADEDMRRISGINESALGEIDQVQSGRAIEARQRQAVISVQTYMDNFKHSKTLLGEMHLGIIQMHYTEERMYRIMGENSKLTETIINQQMIDPNSGVKRILNDVTIGKYATVVDEAPLSATFLNAQFEEMLVLMEKMGPAMGPFMPMFADLMMDLSSLPRKDEWVERFKEVAGMMGMGTQPGAPPPGQAALPAPGMPNTPAQGMAGGNVVPITAARV